MNVSVSKIIERAKVLCFALVLLLWGSASMAFAATPTSTPTVTSTPTNVLPWAQFHLNNDNSGFNQHLDDPYLQPKWQASLQPNGAPNKGDVSYSSPAVVLDLGLLGQPDDPAIGIQGTETDTNTGILCVGTTQGKLLALRTLDGTQLWSYQTQGEIYSSPAFLREGSNSRIYFGSTDGLLRALSSTGNLMWQYQTKGAILSSPTEGMINETTDAVIVGSDDGTVYCLPALPPSGPITPIWTVNLGSPIMGKPALSDDRASVYVGTENSGLYLLNAATGVIESHLSVNGPIRTSPTLQTDTSLSGSPTVIYFAAGSTFYMAKNTGGVLIIVSSTNIGTNIVSSPALAGEGTIPKMIGLGL